MKHARVLIIIATLVMIFSFAGCNASDTTDDPSTLKPFFKYHNYEGSITCSAGDYASVADGEMVTLTAQPYDRYVFACWTKGAYLTDGGEVASENAQFTFAKNSTDVYYANFIKEGMVYVRYYANGGQIDDADAKDGVLLKEVHLGAHLYPATMAQNGTLSREGFVLTEYSSEADGTGTITNIGQRAFSNSKIINLFAQWSPETDTDHFTFAEQDDRVYITGYTGNDEVLTIPAKYNGKTVAGIKENAICSDKIKTVVLPETISVLETAAFNGCSALRTVYLYDTITDMTDESFVDCPIETVCLNSAYDLKYNTEGSCKLELVYAQQASEQNCLVVLSGSSGLYGLDAQLLQNSLSRDYKVVNFGVQIAIPGSFSMRMMQGYLGSGDVLVFAPECSIMQIDNILTTNAFVKYDGVYTAMRNVDIREYSEFFTSLALYATAKVGYTDNLVNAAQQFFHQNGDLTHSKTFAPHASLATFNDPTQSAKATAELYGRVNDAIALLKQNGVKIYLTFAPFCSESYECDVTEEMLDAYTAELVNNLDVICISSQAKHDYPITYFFERYHMTVEGKQLRTENLAQELNAQFQNEQ